jgi:hypothetical protein
MSNESNKPEPRPNVMSLEPVLKAGQRAVCPFMSKGHPVQMPSMVGGPPVVAWNFAFVECMGPSCVVWLGGEQGRCGVPGL